MNRKCPYCNIEAKLVSYYINGTANRLNYFVQCENKCIRTKNRRKAKDAIQDWEDWREYNIYIKERTRK